MDIEQIGLFVVGWFAVGFIVALGLGKILRVADNSEPLDVESGKLSRIPVRRSATARTRPLSGRRKQAKRDSASVQAS